MPSAVTQVRIQEGRLRARTAKRGLALAAAAAFAAALILARVSHPGAVASSGAASSQTPAVDEEGDGGFDFGEGSVGPSSGAAPQVQSGVS